MLGVVVRIVKGSCPDAFDVVSHVSIQDRNKLKKRLGAGGELQTATSVWVWGALEVKPPGNVQVHLVLAELWIHNKNMT